jgi:hypothetical protein
MAEAQSSDELREPAIVSPSEPLTPTIAPPASLVEPVLPHPAPPPVIVVPQAPLLAPPDPFVEDADRIIEELATCLESGATDIASCLDDKKDAAMVKRLESCLGSSAIPAEPAAAKACLSNALP